MHRLSTLHCLGVLAVALALTANPVAAQTCTTSWTNAAGGSWSDPGNWSAGVPGASDDACITLGGTYTVTLTPTTINSLTLGQTSGAGTQTLLHTSGTLTLNAASTIRARGVYEWQDGAIAGDLTNAGLLRLTTDEWKDIPGGAVLTNEGLVEMTDDGPIHFVGGGSGSRFVNAASGTFDLQSDADMGASTFGNTFTNEGLFRKSGGGGGRSEITAGVAFDNNGTVVAEAGTLSFETTGTHTDATFDAAAGAEIFFNGQYGGGTVGTHRVVGTISGDPVGTIRMGGAAVLEGDSLGAVIDFGGTGFEWQGGTFDGSITNAGLLRLTTSSLKDIGGGAVLTNEGLVEMTDDGALRFLGGVDASQFVNAVSGTFDLQSDADFGASSLGNAFANDGILRKSGGAGTSQFSAGVMFDNNAGGVVSVESGELAIIGEVFNHAAGALIQGDGGTFDISGATFSHLGDTRPGTSPGLLTWETDWTPDTGSTLFIELGGTGAPVAGDDYDQLAVVGDAALAGTLELLIAVGDAPQIGDTYTILTAGGSVAGTFDAIVGPFGYTFDVTYNAQSIEVEVLTVPNFDLAAVNTDPAGDPVVVVKPGSIQFDYSVTNNTAAPISGDVFFTASLGSTVLAQGVILSGSVPANSSSPALSFTQGVPGIAPVGTYTYSIKIGQFPNVVVDQVDFTVEVTAASRPADGETSETWAVQEAAPWISADGSVLMTAPEASGAAAETEESAEAASAVVPDTFGLTSAYPNPFRSSTTFALDVPEAARVTVAVYDALGRRVATLLDEEVEAATHRVVWDASDLPSGVYLVRARGAGVTVVQRVTLVR